MMPSNSNHHDRFFNYRHPSMSDSGQFVHGAFNTLESLPSAVATIASEVAYTLDDSADYIASSLWQGLGGEGHDFSPNSMFFNSVVDKGWATTGLNTVGALANGAVSPLKALYEDDSYALGEFAAGMGLGIVGTKAVTKLGASNPTYLTGDTHSPEFMGPVNMKTFYRGDSTQRSSFESTYAEVNGLDATYEFMDSLNDGQRRDIQRDHAVSSQHSPTISLTSNKDVATFFATSGGKQPGVVTTFKFDASNPNRPEAGMPYYNFENAYNMEAPNPQLGGSEFEFLVDGGINSRNVYSQDKVGGISGNNSSHSRSGSILGEGLFKAPELYPTEKHMDPGIINNPTIGLREYGINPLSTRKLENNLRQSDIGSYVLQKADEGVIELRLSLSSNIEINRDFGEASGNVATTFIRNTQTFPNETFGFKAGYDQTASNIVHEGVHALGVTGSRRAEALARIAELRHNNVDVNRASMRAVIEDINAAKVYSDMPWKLNEESMYFPGVRF